MINETAQAVSKGAMYGGSVGAAGLGAACKFPRLQQFMEEIVRLEVSDWYGWCGVAIAFSGFLMNLYFNLRRDRREAAAQKGGVA